MDDKWFWLVSGSGYQRISPGGRSEPGGLLHFYKKKHKSVEKSCLGHFYGPRNVRNRFSILELLFVVPKNTLELLLSTRMIDHFQSDIDDVDFQNVP